MGRECGWTYADLAEFTPHQLADITREVLRQSGERRKADFFDHCWPIAQLTALMANIYRDTKKKPEGFTTADFMPKFEKTEEEKPKPAQTPEQMFMMVRILNAQMGGRGDI